MLATAGCTFITPQATAIQYNPADGVRADFGPLKVRDALVVTDADGNIGGLVAAISNTSDKAQTVQVEFGPKDADGVASVKVPAHSVVTLGNDGEDALTLADFGTKPGDFASIYFSADGDSAMTLVPVFGEDHPYFGDLIPEAPTAIPE